MDRTLRASAFLVALALMGCESKRGISADRQCSVASPPDFTSVSVLPRDMVTDAPRRLVWDDAAQEMNAGRVDLKIRFHNYARPPSDEEIAEVVSRTELLTWPEAEPIAFETEVAKRRNQDSVTLEIIPTEDLPNGWYALRIAEREGFVAEGADQRWAPGRGRLSRFHVGSCPLVLGIETSASSGRTSVVLSETLESSSLRSFGIGSLDGTRNCIPRFSTGGPLGPGKKLDFDCDFEPAANGAKVIRDPSSPIILPKGRDFRPEDFRESKGRIKTNRLALSPAEAMPDCKR